MIVNPSDNNLNNVVVRVDWKRQVISEPNGVLNVYEEKGETDCPAPNALSFTAYEHLTESEVCFWLESIIDMETLDAKLDNELEKIINPQYPAIPIPWDFII
jgi:hypothetical protein